MILVALRNGIYFHIVFARYIYMAAKSLAIKGPVSLKLELIIAVHFPITHRDMLEGVKFMYDSVEI